MQLFDKNGNAIDLAETQTLKIKELTFHTNTTIDIALNSDKGCFMCMMTLNFETGTQACVLDYVYFLNGKINHKISNGASGKVSYSIQGRTLTITCNNNWSKGFICIS